MEAGFALESRLARKRTVRPARATSRVAVRTTPLPSSDGGASGRRRPGFVPDKRGRKLGALDGPGRRAALRNWAETLSVGGLAEQAQQELDAVATTVSAAGHLMTTDPRAIRIAIRCGSAVSAERSGRAERGDHPNRPAQEVVFRQVAWERRSHKLSTQWRALTNQTHSLGECLHTRDKELEFLRGKCARLETRAAMAELNVTEFEAMRFRPDVLIPTREELLPL